MNKPLSWHSRTHTYFSTSLQKEGCIYADAGKVRLSQVSQDVIEGVVFAPDKHEVQIIDDAAAGGFKVQCSCARFQDRGMSCKHLWALIVAADRALKEDGIAPKEKVKPWRRLLLREENEHFFAYTGCGGEFILLYHLDCRSEQYTLKTWFGYMTKAGRVGKRTKKVLSTVLEESDLSPEDRTILEAMENLNQSANPYSSYQGYYRSYYDKIEQCHIPPLMLGPLLPFLAGTGRCRIHFSHAEECSLKKGVPFKIRLQMHSVPDASLRKKSLDLEPLLTGEPPFQPRVFDMAFTILPGLPIHLMHGETLYQLQDTELQAAQLEKIQKKVSVHVPAKDIQALVHAHFTTHQPVEISFPDRCMPENITEVINPGPILELAFDRDGAQGRVFFDYKGLDIAAEDPRQEILDADHWLRFTRHFEAEQKILQNLSRIFPEEDLRLEANTIAPVVAFLAEKGWSIRATDKKKITSGAIASIRVSSGINWFDLDGDVDFDGIIVPLPRVVRAYLKGLTQLDLGNGRIGLLPEKWLKESAPHLQLGTDRAGRAADKPLRFHSSQALLIDSLLDERAEVALDENYAHVRDGLKNFSGITHLDPPRTFQGALRGYQRDSLGWFSFLQDFHFGGILADDMGLGKTVQILAWLAFGKQNGRSGPNLIVLPTSLLYNWQSEAARFTPELSVLIHAGSDRTGSAVILKDHDIVLATYGVLRNDIELLQTITFDHIILDESQMIKNPQSLVAKATRLLNGTNRLCLTGTPLENNVRELWSQMEFLNPGMLGNVQQFDRRFAKPISTGDEDARKALATMIRPFILRRTKEEVARDLPLKTEETIRCPMSEEQGKLYEQVRNHYRSEILAQVDDKGLGRSKIKILEGLLRLRQAACHPGLLLENDELTGKLETLLNMVRKMIASGHKGIVFSQFTRFLGLIRKTMDDEGIVYEYLDGRTPAATRKKRIERFQADSSASLFLISLKAGGVGLNLTAADYVFLMDPWWNPAVEMQAVDRVHRIGQDKPVFTYRFISESTVEEKVVALQEKKRDLVHSMMEGSKGMLNEMTREDIEALFS